MTPKYNPVLLRDEHKMVLKNHYHFMQICLCSRDQHTLPFKLAQFVLIHQDGQHNHKCIKYVIPHKNHTISQPLLLTQFISKK